MSLVLVCDESGAKGYANQPERVPGEVGVMAGFILPADRLDAVGADLDAICLPFRRPGKKLHVTELGPDAERLRAAVYDYFLRHDIPIVYEAIHSHGFYDNHRVNPEAGRESLHTEIALGTFSKAVAYAAQTGEEHSIRVITDRVDQTLLKGFFQAFDEFLDDDPMVEVRRRAHADPAQRTKGWLVAQVSWPDDLEAASFQVAGYTVESDTTESGLTVAADVLAGDLAYFFRNRRGRNFAGPLGREGVLAGYPLERLCQGLTPPDGYPGLCDTIYRHPVEATRWVVEELLTIPDAPGVRDRLADIVRGRAYMIHVAQKGTKQVPDADWEQAREEFGIPPDLWL